MSFDVLILNTAVVDFRSREFGFTEELVGPGGLAKCGIADMPRYSQEQYRRWIEKGLGAAGGPGNAAPLIARAGLNVAVGVNLGGGEFGGLDAQGRFFYDVMVKNGVDMSAAFVHPTLPTGCTFIYDKPGNERGGIAYFANANDDFDFGHYKAAVDRFRPKVVYYMYSGLSDSGDAQGGRALAGFMRWCRGRGAITIADSSTLTGNPQELIDSGRPVEKYRLLEPVLPEADIFFTSYHEARMIGNTIGGPRGPGKPAKDDYIHQFLDFLAQRFWGDDGRSRIFGVTVSDGAFEKHKDGKGTISEPKKVKSVFLAGQVVDLVGAGDSFRAGVISYIAKNIAAFRQGAMNFTEAVQMGNLFACSYISASMNDRYGNIREYDEMLKLAQAYRSGGSVQDS
jgi:sugar/nucleoside kinase (ribokinase family)